MNEAPNHPRPLPETVQTEAQLDELLTRPAPDVAELMRRLRGDIMILGIAGKMGHSLGHMAVRGIREAGVRKRVIGVSRFSEAGARERIMEAGIEAVPCDLLDRQAVGKLPPVPNVIFMAGRKFGTAGSEDMTWALNTLVPANVAERFRTSRIVAFSTGCVYPLVPVGSGGSKETDPPRPIGEYAQSCLGRERVFQFFSQRRGTAALLFRLNYAIDLRYGVLHDLACRIWNNQVIDLTMGHVNVIWQGDACRVALRALEHCAAPAAVLNVTGQHTLPVRDLADRLGQLLDRPVSYAGTPAPTALLSDASRSVSLFGPPTVGLETMLRWTADWVRSGGPSLEKPTHFETRDGQF